MHRDPRKQSSSLGSALPERRPFELPRWREPEPRLGSASGWRGLGGRGMGGAAMPQTQFRALPLPLARTAAHCQTGSRSLPKHRGPIRKQEKTIPQKTVPHRGRQCFGRDLAVSGSAEPLPLSRVHRRVLKRRNYFQELRIRNPFYSTGIPYRHHLHHAGRRGRRRLRRVNSTQTYYHVLL